MQRTAWNGRRPRIPDSLTPFRRRARWCRWRPAIVLGCIALLALGLLVVFLP